MEQAEQNEESQKEGQTTVFNRVVSEVLVGKMRPEQT